MRRLWLSLTFTMILPCGCAIPSSMVAVEQYRVPSEVSRPTLRRPSDIVVPIGLHGREAGGHVEVHFIVSESGKPVLVTLKSSTNSKLDEAALEAVRQSRYNPATKDGIPVPVELDVAFDVDPF